MVWMRYLRVFNEAAESLVQAIAVSRTDLDRALKAGESIIMQLASIRSMCPLTAAHRKQEAPWYSPSTSKPQSSLEKFCPSTHWGPQIPEDLPRCKLCAAQTVSAARAATTRLLHLTLHGWATFCKKTLASSACLDKVTLMQQNQKSTMIVCLVVKAWAAVVASAWRKGAYSSRMVDRVVNLRAARRTEACFCMWLVAIRNARHEAKYRCQLITIAAESSAEVYNLTREAKRTVVELRKQRRAHGVAVIHGNLDRCLQVALHAWYAAAREEQQSAVHQRQLDIAAAESAACHVVMRMQNRRHMEWFRAQWQGQLLRALDDGLRLWCLASFRAWWSTVRSRLEARCQQD